MNDHQFVTGGDAVKTVVEEPEKGGAIQAAAESNEDAIAVVDETVTLNSLSHQASHLSPDRKNLGMGVLRRF
jgi:hypothetical protein